jgi:hypothetical protein
VGLNIFMSQNFFQKVNNEIRVKTMKTKN